MSRADPEWLAPPPGARPVPIARSEIIARSDAVAIILHRVEAVPTGVTFTLSFVEPPTPDGQQPPAHDLSSDLMGRPGYAREHGFRLGLMLDGDRRTERDAQFGPHTNSGDREPTIALSNRGGAGGGGTFAADFFAWPLPATGDLTLVVRWDNYGITERQIVLPGDELRAAAAQSESVWP